MFGVVQNNSNYENKKKRKVQQQKSYMNFSHFFQSKKFLMPFFVIIVIIFAIGYYLYKNYYRNYNYIKIDSSNYLVYTLDTKLNNQNLYSEIPYININSDDAKLVNETIEKYAEQFLKNKNNLLVYNSQLNGDILSISLRMADYRSGYSFPDVSFYTYNFDLRTCSLMTDDELLNLFHVDKDDVSKKIEKAFKKYYDDEVYQGYLVKEECDYACFLEWREVDDYMDSVHYFVENGKLGVYRSFNIYSIYGEEDYYKDEDYKFYITE